MLAGRCDPETVRDCDGKTLRALCARCGKNGKLRGWGAHYAASLLRVHLLQEAGFRFENDSFDLQFWFDMAFLKRKILSADFR